MKNKEKLRMVVTEVRTTPKESQSYVLGRITGTIETIIIGNKKANGCPLIITDPDDSRLNIIKFWATDKQMDLIRTALPKIIGYKLADFLYYKSNSEEEEES